MKARSSGIARLAPLLFTISVATLHATVGVVGVDSTTGPNWRTGAALETDGQYGTLGYVVFGLNEANGVYTGNYNIGISNPANAYSLPAGVAISTTNTGINMWSGNGNFGTLQDPGNGNAPTPAPLLANYGANPKNFTITRATSAAYRITLITASGDNAGATYTPSVNDGSGALSTSYKHTANGVAYHVFQVSEGTSDIVIGITSTPNWSLTGIAFDEFVQVPVGPALTWIGSTGAWDTTTTGNWKKQSDGSPAIYSDSPANPVLFDDTATGTTVDVSGANVSPASVEFSHSAKNFTLQGSAGIAGFAGLTKSGTGTLTLANPNTYAGGTTIGGGTLKLGGAGTLGGGSYAGPIINNGMLHCESSANQTLSGVISGTGPLEMNGQGELTLSGMNTFTGNILVSGGVLIAAGSSVNSAFGSFGNLQVAGKTITVNPGATLRHGNNDLYFNGAAAQAASLAKIVINGGTLDTGSFYSCINNLDIRSGGTVTGTNGVVAPFRSLALTGNVTCTGGTGVVSTMSAPGANGGIHLGHSQFGVSSVTFEVDAASGGLDVAGPLVNRSNAQDAGSLVKTGDGTLTLSGAATHTYTGTTTVNGGTLAVTGTLGSASAAVAVNSSATLTGNGTISRPVTINSGAFLTPGGAAIDTLSVGGALTLAAGSKTTCQIDKAGGVTTQDLLDTGSVSYGGTLEVVATGSALGLGDSFKLFNATTYGGAFSGAILPTLSAGLQWDLSTLTTDGTITVVNTAVPPLFNPLSGGYVGALAVTMTSAPGGTIHYTTDGSDPKTSGTVISGASPLVAHIPTDTQTVTLTAYASQSGFGNSATVSATYSTVTTPTWNVDDNGDWSDPTKWRFGVVADGSGITANFNTVAQNADTTIILDGSRTIGRLVVGNTNPFNWSLTGASGGVLTLAAPGTPEIDITSQTAMIGVPIAGNQGFIKQGPGILQLTHAGSTYTGDITVANGPLMVSGSTGGPNPATGSLGNPGVARSITVNNGGTLSFGAHDILGNHAANVVVALAVGNGATVNNSGNFFTALGSVTLAGGTIHAVGGANASFPAFALKGTVTVLDATSSTISGSGTNAAYQLGAAAVTGTTFDTQGTGTLVISGELHNGRAANHAAQPSSLVKSGTGTLTLAGVNSYTGNTTVYAGTLTLADNARLRFVIGNASGVNNQLSGPGTVRLDGDFAIDTTAAAALSTGTWLLENATSLAGDYGTTFSVVDPDGTPWADAGSNKWTRSAGAGRTWTFDEATGELTLGASGGFDSWAAENGVTGGANGDSDHDGIPNLVEYALDLNPAASDGAAGTFVGGLLSFTKRAVAVTNGDVTYAIQESDDLGLTDAWTTVPATTDNPATISYGLPTGAAKKFARLVVTRAP